MQGPLGSRSEIYCAFETQFAAQGISFSQDLLGRLASDDLMMAIKACGSKVIHHRFAQ
jgi:hypothetical protein